MDIRSGYFKKRLHVDLTEGTSRRLPIGEEFIKRYIGGRGFGAKLLWDHLVKHDFRIDPLGPDNLLVIAPGPLTGTYCPSAGKTSFVALSPQTGIYGDSSIGGTLGIELRQTGIDALSILGRAPSCRRFSWTKSKPRSFPCPSWPESPAWRPRE